MPNSPNAHAQKAEILRLLGSKLAAIDELRVVCVLNQYDESAAEQLGNLYKETGQYEKAIEAYRLGLEAGELRMAALMPSDDASPWTGIVKMISPNTWPLHCSIARCFVALKRYDEAVDSFRRALDILADDARPETRLMLERELAACREALGHPR